MSCDRGKYTAKVFVKVRVIEPGSGRIVQGGTMMRTARVVGPLEENRGSLRSLTVRAFGEGAHEKYWAKGNLLVLKCVTVRPDEKCLKITQETLVEIAEKSAKWKLEKNVRVPP